MQLGDDGDRSNVEDRRGSMLGGTGVRLGLGGTVVVALLSVVFGKNLFSVVGSPSTVNRPEPGRSAQVQQRKVAEAPLEKVAVASFNDVQRVWSEGVQGFRPARLVLFWDETRSGCGEAAAGMGPFYCPADERVYIDLRFYRELATRFGAPGEFAQAYVIAHEVGHHLQNLLGVERKVRVAQQHDPSRRNALSVRLELQADCFAGAWGKSADRRRLLDPGDVEAGLRAAAAVGDDRLQRAATGRANPEMFTHGSAEQRSHWFRRGFERGDLKSCDTFGSNRK